jgi:murein DD-endopeptidase MepM/ murein hydrolase activator NlpD
MNALLQHLYAHAYLSAAVAVALVVLLVVEFRMAAQSFAAVSPQEAVLLANRGALLVDVRNADAYAAGHLGSARNFPGAAIADGADAFPERQRTELAYALADILEYRVDLRRDLQKNDSVRVMVERQTAENGLVRPGNIIAARMTVDGKPVETMRFTQAGRVAYFDGEGKSMRAAFLRAPLAFRRISSVFGMRRHPILGTMRRHAGTDYAAAAGTPVRALGNGRVIFAGWRGGYGKTVEIRHNNGFVTRYGHLRAFNVRSGQSVSISQTIGQVGSTGLSTAPHLHFEVLVNGVHRDPRVALKNQSGEPLAAAQRRAFQALKNELFAQLDQPSDRPESRSVTVTARPNGD